MVLMLGLVLCSTRLPARNNVLGVRYSQLSSPDARLSHWRLFRLATKSHLNLSGLSSCESSRGSQTKTWQGYDYSFGVLGVMLDR